MRNPNKIHTFITFLFFSALSTAAPLHSKSINSCENLTYIDAQLEHPSVILEAVKRHKQTKTYNLFSHGRPGELFIQGQWLNAHEIAVWLRDNQPFNNIAIESLNIYGCEFAKGTKGTEAVKYLERELGISIAASNNVTGADGDWDLEIGNNTNAVVVNNYKYNLQCAGTIGGLDHDDDFDGDGICNELDLDDDNDGLLDTDEYNYTLIGVNPTHIIPAAQIDTNTSYASGSGDVSTRLGLPAGTVTITYADVETSSTTSHFNCRKDSTPDFVVTSSYPLKFRPRLGKTEYGNPGAIDDPERGFTSNDPDMSFFMTNDNILNTGFSAGSTGNNYYVKRDDQTAISNFPVAGPPPWPFMEFQSDHFATNFDITLYNEGNDADYKFQFLVPADTDGDGIPDYLDLDSDNDGITDIQENGGTDIDQDGEVDYPTSGVPTSMVDTNSNGWSSVFDDGSADGLPTEGGTPLANADTDIDGLSDYLDLDSDADGILDNVEGQSTAGYIAPSGTDTDEDGIDDAYDVDCTPCNGITGAPFVPYNRDVVNDTIPDYLDLDTDGDSKPDVLEAWDSDANGTAEYTAAGNDQDNDGLDDAFDSDFTPAHGATQLAAITANALPTTMYGYAGPGTEPNWRQGPPNTILVYAYLEGPHSNATAQGLGQKMTTDLSTGGASSILATNALAQPYNTAPWNYAGTETVTANFFVTHTNIVDWVLIELRDKDDASSILYRKACFLTNDGALLDINGNVGADVLAPADDYFLSIVHRNHANVASATAVSVTAGTATWDIRTDDTDVYTNGSQKNVKAAGSDFVMYGGDNDNDQSINASDVNAISTDFFKSGYYLGDTYLDGVVNATDVNIISLNFFLTITFY